MASQGKGDSVLGMEFADIRLTVPGLVSSAGGAVIRILRGELDAVVLASAVTEMCTSGIGEWHPCGLAGVGGKNGFGPRGRLRFISMVPASPSRGGRRGSKEIRVMLLMLHVCAVAHLRGPSSAMTGGS